MTTQQETTQSPSSDLAVGASASTRAPESTTTTSTTAWSASPTEAPGATPVIETPSIEPSRIVLVPIASIVPDPDQPRTQVHEPELESLAATIRQCGVLHPIHLTHAAFGLYRVLIGERRLRAAKLAGLTSIPAIVVPEPSAGERRVLQLIENTQRADLDLRDRACAVAELDRTGMPQKEIAEKLGKSTATVSKLVTIGELLVTLPAQQDRFVADVLGQEEVYGIAIVKPGTMTALRQYLRHLQRTEPKRMAGYDKKNDPLGLALAPKPPSPPSDPSVRRKAKTHRERVRAKLLKHTQEDAVEIVVSTVDDKAIADLLRELLAIDDSGKSFDAAASRAQRLIEYPDDLMANCTQTVDSCDETLAGGAEDQDHDHSNGAASDCYAENAGGYVLD